METLGAHMWGCKHLDLSATETPLTSWHRGRWHPPPGFFCMEIGEDDDVWGLESGTGPCSRKKRPHPGGKKSCWNSTTALELLSLPTNPSCRRRVPAAAPEGPGISSRAASRQRTCPQTRGLGQVQEAGRFMTKLGLSWPAGSSSARLRSHSEAWEPLPFYLRAKDQSSSWAWRLPLSSLNPLQGFGLCSSSSRAKRLWWQRECRELVHFQGPGGGSTRALTCVSCPRPRACSALHLHRGALLPGFVSRAAARAWPKSGDSGALTFLALPAFGPDTQGAGRQVGSRPIVVCTAAHKANTGTTTQGQLHAAPCMPFSSSSLMWTGPDLPSWTKKKKKKSYIKLLCRRHSVSCQNVFGELKCQSNL